MENKKAAQKPLLININIKYAYTNNQPWAQKAVGEKRDFCFVCGVYHKIRDLSRKIFKNAQKTLTRQSAIWKWRW
jgi:hypothetical protein